MKKEFKSNYYAQALFNIARADGIIEKVEDELGQLKDAIVFNLDFKKFLTDPVIQKHEKIKSASEILGSQSSSVIKAFAAMIIILDSVEYADQIYKDYLELTNQFKKQVSVDVVSAIELDDNTILEIKKDIDVKTGLDVRVKNVIDKDIVGGLILKIGDRVIDLSVRNKIEDMKLKLKALELEGEDFGIEN